MRGPTSSKLYTFRRMIPTFSVQGNAAYTQYNSVSNINLNQLPNVSEFTSLFDQYRITGVTFKFFLRYAPEAQSSTTAIIPKLWWCRDTNDSTVLTQADMKQRADAKVRVLNPYRPVVIRVRPNLLQNLYVSGVANCYSAVWNKFIDTASPGAPYYGIKWNLVDFTTVNYQVDVEASYTIQCKSVQ